MHQHAYNLPGAYNYVTSDKAVTLYNAAYNYAAEDKYNADPRVCFFKLFHKYVFIFSEKNETSILKESRFSG